MLIFPADIRGEVVAHHYRDRLSEVQLRGKHKRNAYQDILKASTEEEKLQLELSKPGLYDILPEAMFHPVDRFEGIPANVYKERVAEEIERQKKEEDNAREYFSRFDRFVFDLNTMLAQLKQDTYGGNAVISDMICDDMEERYRSNRFVMRMMEFMPYCSRLRGNWPVLSLVVRKILKDEGLVLRQEDITTEFRDCKARYKYRFDEEEIPLEEMYLGNVYEEEVKTIGLSYWSDEECNESFMEFVAEIGVFRDFLNDYFMGMETGMAFDISGDGMEVVLDDDSSLNYLGFNTNL